MDVRAAQRLADERELDLVKLSNANPPTCKLMDYSKHRYDMMKREKEQRKNQKIIEIKEIRLSATIDQHDMEVKAKACSRFLQDGNKVKVSIRFRGRQITRGDIGEEVMTTFFNMVSDKATQERAGRPSRRAGTCTWCWHRRIKNLSGGKNMPKIKTHRGAAKRFDVTKSGKIKRGKAYKSHILTKKTTKRLRGLRQTGYIAEEEQKKIRELIPYK